MSLADTWNKTRDTWDLSALVREAARVGRGMLLRARSPRRSDIYSSRTGSLREGAKQVVSGRLPGSSPRWIVVPAKMLGPAASLAFSSVHLHAAWCVVHAPVHLRSAHLSTSVGFAPGEIVTPVRVHACYSVWCTSVTLGVRDTSKSPRPAACMMRASIRRRDFRATAWETLRVLARSEDVSATSSSLSALHTARRLAGSPA